MATARIRYVDTASSGGNGTTPALSGANAAYASLQAALDAERGDLVAADARLEIICATNGNADTVRVNQPATGWTTDATRYVHVKAAPGHRAGTQWATNKYRIEGTWDYVAAVYSGIPYFRIEGIQARNRSALTESKGFAFDCTTLACDIRLDSLFTQGNVDSGIVCSGGTYIVRNCVSIGNGGYGFLFSYGIPGCVADGDNLTAVANAALGIHSGSGSNDVTLRNCYSGGNGGDDYTGSYAWTALTTCYSEDGTASTTTAAYSSSSGACFASVVAGSQNVALMASSSLRDVGTDLSSDFSTDIAGSTRSAPWDIGAFEFVVESTDAFPQPLPPAFGVFRRVAGRIG